jgi:hypothetical protein
MIPGDRSRGNLNLDLTLQLRSGHANSLRIDSRTLLMDHVMSDAGPSNARPFIAKPSNARPSREPLSKRIKIETAIAPRSIPSKVPDSVIFSLANAVSCSLFLVHEIMRPRVPVGAQLTVCTPMHTGTRPPILLPCKQIMAESIFEGDRNIFFDESDLIAIAASLACTSHPMLSRIADAIFFSLSPRLGEDLPGGISTSSDIKELQDLADFWELMSADEDKKKKKLVWRDKVALWHLINDEVRALTLTARDLI